MKKLLFITLLVGLTSCNNNYVITETPTSYCIDSVQYHGVGHDNIMQISPYWKLHLDEPNVWIRSNVKYSKGDSIVVNVRKVKNYSPDWYNYTH
jgi:hypothetical protein